MTSLGHGIRRFFTWWLVALSELIPNRLRRGQRSLVLDLSDELIAIHLFQNGAHQRIGRVALAGDNAEGVRKTLATLLREAEIGAKLPVALRIPDERALRNRIEFPLAAEADLCQAIALRLDRLVPLPPEDVRFDHHIVDRDPARGLLTVELVAVHRNVIQSVLEQARGWGFEIDQIDIGETPPDQPPTRNLLRDRNGAAASRTWHPVHTALAAVSAVLLLSAAALPLVHRSQNVTALQAEIEDARLASQDVISLRMEVDRLREERDFLDLQKHGLPARVVVLDNLTRLLPDDTWLFQLEISGSEGRMRGFSDLAANLVSVIDTAPDFDRPTFRSPIVQDQNNGHERFDLSFEIKSQGERGR